MDAVVGSNTSVKLDQNQSTMLCKTSCNALPQFRRAQQYEQSLRLTKTFSYKLHSVLVVSNYSAWHKVVLWTREQHGLAISPSVRLTTTSEELNVAFVRCFVLSLLQS